VVRSNFPVDVTRAQLQVQGNRAYLIGSTQSTPTDKLVILDVSNPDAPANLGALDLPYTSCRPYVVGTSLYMPCGTAYMADRSLYIYDVSNPAAPTLLGDYIAPRNIRSVQVVGNRAYLVGGPPDAGTFFTPECPGGGSTFWIVDVSIPTVPVPIGKSTIGTCAKLLQIAPNSVYVTESGTIKLLDISNPENPVIASSVAMPVPGNVVQLEGSIAYVVNGSTLTLIDIGVFSSPIVRGSYNFNNTSISELTVVGSHAYVMSSNGLSILDISNPDLPLLESASPFVLFGSIPPIAVGAVTSSGSHNADNEILCDCPETGDRLFLIWTIGSRQTSFGFVLASVDVSTPASPTLLAFYNTARPAWQFPYSPSSSLAIAHGLVFLISGADKPEGWDILDVTNRNRIVRVGRYQVAGVPRAAQIVGDRLYVGTDSGLQILQIAATECTCNDIYLPGVQR
jgi:hypothetical protein